jgi:RNA polymerase sigma-70 factor (ECF subfamily)
MHNQAWAVKQKHEKQSTSELHIDTKIRNFVIQKRSFVLARGLPAKHLKPKPEIFRIRKKRINLGAGRKLFSVMASNIKNADPLDEKEVIERLMQRDQAAFRELVDQQHARVYNTALGLLQNDDDARDITQEVFLEVFESVNRFRGEAKLTTWIYRITVQKSLEYLRTRNRKKRAAVVLSLFGRESKLTIPAPPFYHPGVLLENKERSAILFAAIGKLPSMQRVAFTLHKVEHFSYAEISGIMQSSVSSVESLIFRAKQNLQALLSEYYENNEP